VIGFLLVAWKIPAIPPTNPGKPDVLGLALVGLALALGMFGLETVGRHVVADPWPGVALMTGVVIGVAAYFHCRRATRPAIDFALLKIPTFRQPALFGSLFRVGAGAVPFLVPVMLQIGFGMSASESGLISFATALGAFTMKPLVRPLLRRFGFRNALLINGVLAAGGIALLAFPNPTWPVAAIFLLLACGGLFRSLQFTALNTLVFADVPPEKLSAATSFYSTLQQLSPALGVVLATATLEASRLFAERAELALVDFSVSFIAASVVTVLSIPMLLSLARDAGAEVSGHMPKHRHQ
jgi:MFS family permease